MSTARWKTGDVFEQMATIPDGSIETFGLTITDHRATP